MNLIELRNKAKGLEQENSNHKKSSQTNKSIGVLKLTAINFKKSNIIKK
jgi:hypothetical protein